MKTLLILLFPIFSDISPLFSMHQKENPGQEVKQIIKNYSSEIKGKLGVSLTSYGFDFSGPDKIYDGKIHEISVGYAIATHIQYGEARALFYSIVDGLLDTLNKNEKIRSYFYHFPVSYEDLYFRLSFDASGQGHLKKDDVSMIYILENKISYLIVDQEDNRPADHYRRADLEIEHMLSTTRTIDRPLPEGPEAEAEY